MNKLGKVAVALAMAFSVGAAFGEEPLCLLKYLRTTGTQYINLDYYPTPKTTVVYNFYVTDYTKAQQGHFGSWGGDFSYYSRVRGANKHTWGYADVEPSEAGTPVTEPRANGLFKIELNGTNKTFRLWKNGVRTVNSSMTSVATQTASLPMYLFSVNHNGTAEPMELVAFYDMQIYEDGILVRDLKPCWTKEYETAVYDALTKTIYRNAGTGSFIAGPRIGSVTGDVHLQPQGEGLDDTAAIIETLKTLGGGDMLYLDAGQWNVSSNITVPAGTILSGVGCDKTVVRYAGSGLYKGYLFKVADEATLKDMTLKGATTALSSTRDCLGPVFVNNAFGDPAIVENLTITGFFHTYENFYEGYSGAAIRADSAATIRGCVITNNQSSASGGRSGYYPGIAIRTTSAATLVEGCVIRKNKRTNGSVDEYSAPLVAKGGTIRNCLVADNSSCRVTGVYATGSARIVNCTIANNVCNDSSNPGVCAACYGSVDVEFVNCLVTGNKGKDGTLTPTNTTATATFSYCLMEEPVYRDAAAGDYYVLDGEGINTGTNEDWMVDATDIAGTSRIKSGRVDIGCYEFVPAALQVFAVPQTETTGAGSLKAKFEASVRGEDLEGLVYSWYFSGQETPDFEGAEYGTAEWTFTAGQYPVMLKVRNASGETDEIDEPLPVFVALGTAYVATDSTPAFPYDTVATAANDFDTLIGTGLVNSGTEIRVCPGTYPLASTLTPAGVVSIVSTEGPAVTTLKGAANGFQLVKLSTAGSLLAGFTLKGTNVRCAQIAGSTMSNCVVRGVSSEASASGDAGVAAYATGASKILDCVFSGNQYAYAGGSSRNGGVVYSPSGNLLIDRCVFTNNIMGTSTKTQDADRRGIAVYIGGSGTIRNSLFAKQTTKIKENRTGADTRTTGTIAINGSGTLTVENCTVADNLAEGETTCGGIWCGDNATVNVINSIVTGNHNTNGDATDIRYSATDPTKTTVTTSLVNEDPKFRRPAKGDYSIRPSSPARDAGTNAVWMNGAVDLGGALRIIGGRVDIGCYENNGHGFTILVR